MELEKQISKLTLRLKIIGCSLGLEENILLFADQKQRMRKTIRLKERLEFRSRLLNRWRKSKLKPLIDEGHSYALADTPDCSYFVPFFIVLYPFVPKFCV